VNVGKVWDAKHHWVSELIDMIILHQIWLTQIPQLSVRGKWILIFFLCFVWSFATLQVWMVFLVYELPSPKILGVCFKIDFSYVANVFFCYFLHCLHTLRMWFIHVMGIATNLQHICWSKWGFVTYMNIFAAWKSLKCCNTFICFFMRARGANGAHHQIFCCCMRDVVTVWDPRLTT
jgi:hypothetical protein